MSFIGARDGAGRVYIYSTGECYRRFFFICQSMGTIVIVMKSTMYWTFPSLMKMLASKAVVLYVYNSLYRIVPELVENQTSVCRGHICII